MEKYGGQSNYRAEATYYLEIANYVLKDALKEFEEDFKFEKEQRQKSGSKGWFGSSSNNKKK